MCYSLPNVILYSFIVRNMFKSAYKHCDFIKSQQFPKFISLIISISNNSASGE